MAVNTVISAYHEKLLDEHKTLQQELFSKPLESIKFDCSDPIQVRVCAHRKPVGVQFDIDSVEDLEVNSPLYYSTLMKHREGKAVYFTDCLDRVCNHPTNSDCRIVARYHIANIMLLLHLRYRCDYGLQWKDLLNEHRPYDFLKDDFDFVSRCEHSSDEDGDDTDLLSE